MGKRTERSRITYDNMAAGYDASPEGNYTRPHKAELVKRVALREGDCILDVACGNGTLLGELSRKADVCAHGVDLSENMIAAAKERHPQGSFLVGPCAPLPFAENSMDAITVSCAFHHFEDPRAFAEECMRVLKSGGTLYMAEPFFPAVVRWLANTLWFPFSKSGDVWVYSQRELCRVFEAAGFRAIESEANGSVLFFSAKKQHRKQGEA